MRLLDNLTVVSWGSFRRDGDSKNFASKQVALMRAYGVNHIFVDIGSESPLSTATIFMEGASEAEAKNEGLSHVTSKYIAFTDYDTLVSANTISRTQDVIINAGVDGRGFILQGYPWIMSTYLRTLLIADQMDVKHNSGLIENMSIAVAVPRMPSGSWQVCRTADAKAVGGFDETLSGDPTTDFHERMRAYCILEGGIEVLSKGIPIPKAGFLKERECMYSPALDRFMKRADKESLRWNDGFI